MSDTKPNEITTCGANNFAASGHIRVLIDMDEVLCDFVGAALRVHGWSRDQFNALHVKGRWDMTITLGLTAEQFWRPINREGSHFWEWLKPLPWYREVLAQVKSLTDDWLLVTSPGLCAKWNCPDSASYLGKAEWIKKHLGNDALTRYVPTIHKHALANNNTILIDDSFDNCTKFRQHGGGAIVFPTLHNHLWYISGDPMSVVWQHVEAIRSQRCT